MANNIYLIEDHDQALKVWQERKAKGLDLVHIDAHMDFGFYPASPPEQVMQEAQSVKQLKEGLERALLYQKFQSDFNKQTNIGNYVYPAMRQGIVQDFYWVIPGGLKEFKQSLRIIKRILRCTLRAARCTLKDGIISADFLGRKIVICVLEKLPILKQRVLLDIDTDFLVVDSLLNANNTVKIGKRQPWISPVSLADHLKVKIKHLAITTIAYSVNGGYTPIRYRVLGDELAHHLCPRNFQKKYKQELAASIFFRRFETTGKREYYQQAIRINPAYRVADNNYGNLYLSVRKFSQAQKEFLRIARVDLGNPYPYLGLGNIALEKKCFRKAKGYFTIALKQKKSLVQALLGLAQVEFRLKNFKESKKLFFRYLLFQPLHSSSRYFLGRIYEKNENFKKAAIYYRGAMSLGMNNLDILKRLLKISCYLKDKNDILELILIKYGQLRRQFLNRNKISLNRDKNIKKEMKFEAAMASLKKKLINVNFNKRILAQIVKLVVDYKAAEKIVLFGSRALGSWEDTSDIDIAIFAKGWTDKDINIVKHKLDEYVKTPLKIDLLNFYALSKKALRENILKEGKVIYDSKKD